MGKLPSELLVLMQGVGYKENLRQGSRDVLGRRWQAAIDVAEATATSGLV